MRIRSFIPGACAPFILSAQGPAAERPQILTSATVEVQVKPDRATLTFSVESRDATAAKAAAETARKQRQVIDTLRARGVGADEMTTASIEIYPELAYPGENKPPRVTGYVARNSLRVQVRAVDQTGTLIDAALSKEATGIGALEFSSSRRDEARRQALELAVAKARSEAESMAKASGGTLGGLIELSAQPEFVRRLEIQPGVMRVAAEVPSMPVTPGQLTISATVSAKWAYTRP